MNIGSELHTKNLILVADDQGGLSLRRLRSTATSLILSAFFVAAVPMAATAAAADPDTVIIGTSSDITTVDMGQYVVFGVDVPVLDNVYDSLTSRNPDGTIAPAIATEWSVSDDGLTWTVNLRDDVLFHDGSKMTAKDVAFSFERFKNPDYNSTMATRWAGFLDNVEVVDDHTVKINLKEPRPLLMHGSPFFSPIISATVASGKSAADLNRDVETAIGTGPYRLAEWVSDQRVVLEAFPDHWRGAPAMKSIVFRPIPEASSRTAALLAGEIDISVAYPIDQVAVIEGRPDLEIRSQDGVRRTRLVINANNKPFDNVAVRQAVNAAIDREAITTNLLQGYATPLPTLSAPVEVGFNKDLDPNQYNLERARELMAEAGYPDGYDGELVMIAFNGFNKVEEASQALADQLSAIGLNTRIRLVKAQDYGRLSANKEFDLGLGGSSGGASFHVRLALHSVFSCKKDGHPNFSGFYCDDELQEKLDTAKGLMQDDPEAALDLYREIQSYCYDQACMAGLWTEHALYGVRSDLEWQPHPSGMLWMYSASRKP